MIKYIKSVLWRVAKRLSYIEDARCLKVNSHTSCTCNSSIRKSMHHAKYKAECPDLFRYNGTSRSALLELYLTTCIKYQSFETFEVSVDNHRLWQATPNPPYTHTHTHTHARARNSFYTAHILTQHYILMIPKTYTISYTYTNPLERPLPSKISSIPRYVITLKSIPSL